MKTGEIRIIWVLVALIVSIGLLLGIHKIYINLLNEKPVNDQIKKLSFVEDVNIEKADKVNVFKVKIRQPGNIRNEYQAVEDCIEGKYESGEYEIVFNDRRNSSLQDLADSLQPSIYEAIAKNNYLWLVGQIETAAGQHNYEYKVFMDEKRIYLQLWNGQNFLYQVVNWPPADVNNEDQKGGK